MDRKKEVGRGLESWTSNWPERPKANWAQSRRWVYLKVVNRVKGLGGMLLATGKDEDEEADVDVQTRIVFLIDWLLDWILIEMVQLWRRTCHVAWCQRLHGSQWMPWLAMSQWSYVHQSGATSPLPLHLSRWLLGRELRTGAGGTNPETQHGRTGGYFSLPVDYTKWAFILLPSRNLSIHHLHQS